MKQDSILLIDNYDSFTYNVVHLIRDITRAPITVKRNDEVSLEEARSYSRIILSPGPGIPKEAGNMPEIVNALSGTVPIFGICLGHQCIGEESGGTLLQLSRVMHGVQSKAIQTTKNSLLFAGLPETFTVGRYHSWAINRHSLPKEFSVTAVDDSDVILAFENREKLLFGVQFHPESILTEFGKEMTTNFLQASR